MKVLSLAGTWNLREAGSGASPASAQTVPARLPGDILSALVEAGLAPDPYRGEDERPSLWVASRDWLLEREFLLDPAFLQADRIFLDLESVDTVAEVRINGGLVGSSDNMFIRFRKEAKDFLVPGLNLISVLIRSPEREAASRAAALPYSIPASTYPISSPHRNLLRKAQCMGGWDWGPCLMTGGVYDGLSLTAVDGPRLDYLRAEVQPLGPLDLPLGAERGPDFRLAVSVEADSAQEGDYRLALRFDGDETSFPVRLTRGALRLEASLEVKSPRLWWPNGAGSRSLYGLEARLLPLDEAEGGGRRGRGQGGAAHAGRPGSAGPQVLWTSVGFRVLEVRTEEDGVGREMRFLVNGHSIFAKGANWIPADALPSRWTGERLAELLGSAAEAGMNCLRVWGGGRYESDDFYALCDKLGLLVWQDCMFSCALYPSDPAFLGSVEAEISHQVKRLSGHPSLALWCGNNEALGAITWYEESRNNPARYIVDYDRLTEGVLGRTIRALDPGRLFWPSSPSAGPKDFSDNWKSDERGDMHFWQVWHEGRPFSAYLEALPRFCSEFGFQSFPSLRAVRGFAGPEGLNVSSPAMEGHQRHPKGNTLILDTMLRHFRMPRDFGSTLYLSQVQQALAIKTAVEWWRTNRPRCSGSLYWQLNDVWPGSSWSSLEHDGSWKLLHHEAKRFYAPLILALCLNGGSLELRAANDSGSPWRGIWTLAFRRFDGSLVSRLEGRAEVAPEASALLAAFPVSSFPAPAREIYAEAEFGAEGGPDRRAFAFLAEPKRCSLLDPGLEAALGPGPEGSVVLKVSARAAPAFFVAPELVGLPGRFEDSGFYLARGESRSLRFLGPVPAPAGEVLVRHLRSSYE